MIKKALDFYDKNYKILTFVPLVLLLISFAIIGMNFARTGELIERDVSLKGGVTITVAKAMPSGLETDLEMKFAGTSFDIRQIGDEGIGFIVEADVTDQAKIAELVNEIRQKSGATQEETGTQVIGSSLGASFYSEAIRSILIAFIFMGLVVLIYFRNFMPSIFVIFAAFCDIVMPFAVLILLGVKLSSAGIAAFLMLIGYSVDTDILLTSKVLRAREGTIFERIIGALKTGMTMTLCGLVVVTIGYFFSQAETLKQIMLILALGLIFDVFNTWLTNAGLLRMYLERKKNG